VTKWGKKGENTGRGGRWATKVCKRGKQGWKGNESNKRRNKGPVGKLKHQWDVV